MNAPRSKFAGGDQAYLRDEQYHDGTKLADRANLHARYGTTAVPWLDWVANHVHLRDGADVLEVGCGAGWLWHDASFDVPNDVSLTLTDLSPGMVREALALATAAGRPARVAGQVADLQALPFETESFDCVIANHMLYHLPDPALGVAELARVVRPDGLVVAATNGPAHLRELWEVRAAVFGTSPVDETADVFAPDNGFPLLRQQFGDVRWHAYPDRLRCTDLDDLLRYVCSTPPAETADDDQLRELAALFQDRLDAGGGVFTVTKEVGCFTCREPVGIDGGHSTPSKAAG